MDSTQYEQQTHTTKHLQHLILVTIGESIVGKCIGSKFSFDKKNYQ